jgi:hypothetical protein
VDKSFEHGAICRHTVANICVKLSLLLIWAFVIVGCIVLRTSFGCVGRASLLIQHLLQKCFISHFYLWSQHYPILHNSCSNLCFVSRWIHMACSFKCSLHTNNRFPFSEPWYALWFYLRSLNCIEADDQAHKSGVL